MVDFHTNGYSVFLYKHLDFICASQHTTGSLLCVKYSTHLLHLLQKTSWRCSYSVFPKEGSTPVNFVTETSPRPLAVRGKKKKKRQSVSRLCCTSKSECQWISQSVSPYHQSMTRTVRRPSALPVATLTVVCGSARWVSPSGTLWLHPYKSESSTGLPSFHLSHYRVGVWRNSH